MIDLHERLSEFSCYGVTRETEQLLADVGVRTVPFMPSLLQEKQIGFDVGFGSRGVPLLLQFKLGQSLHRFVRVDKRYPAPALEKPFFRFSIDTGEPDGQYETLLKAQVDGAEAYYVAPRFSDWPKYVSFFENGEVLQRSVMVPPGEIRGALVSKGSPDGPHRIVYDRSSVHICSEPAPLRDAQPETIARDIASRMESGQRNLGQTVHRIYIGLEDRSAIRRRTGIADSGEESEIVELAMDERVPDQIRRDERDHRLEKLRGRARSEEDAVAAALGLELWPLGIQLLFATK